MRSGCGLNHTCLPSDCVADAGVTTGRWSTGSSSGCGPGSRGGIFPSDSAAGRPSTNVTGAGQPTVLGIGFSGRFRPIPTWRADSTGAWWASTRQCAGPTSTRPGPARPPRGSRKKNDASKPPPRRGTRPVPGRPDLQDPPRRRGRLPPARPAGHPGPVGRCTPVHRSARPDLCRPTRGRTPPHQAGPRQRRQGIQLTPQPQLPAVTPDQAHDPRTEGPAGQPQTPREQGRPAHRLRQRALQAPQRSRTDHQPAQTPPGRRHPLRQTRLRIPGHHRRRLDPPLAPPVIRRMATRPSSQPRVVPQG